jgi:hypothetical protein
LVAMNDLLDRLTASRQTRPLGLRRMGLRCAAKGRVASKLR